MEFLLRTSTKTQLMVLTPLHQGTHKNTKSKYWKLNYAENPETLDSLATYFKEIQDTLGSASICLGAPSSAALRAEKVRRISPDSPALKKPEAAGDRSAFADVNWRSNWLPFDIDGFPVNGVFLENPEYWIDAAIQVILPKEFHGVSYVYVLSKKAGTKDHEHEVRTHLWFKMERKVARERFVTWARSSHQGFDTAPYDKTDFFYIEQGRRIGVVAKAVDSCPWSCPSLIRRPNIAQTLTRGEIEKLTLKELTSKFTEGNFHTPLVATAWGLIHRGYTVEEADAILRSKIDPGRPENQVHLDSLDNILKTAYAKIYDPYTELDTPATTLTLSKARAWLVEQCKLPGKHAIIAPPGVGKTYAAHEALIDHLVEAPWHRVLLLSPTNDLLEDQAHAIYEKLISRRLGDLMPHRCQTRRKGTCSQLVELGQATRLLGYSGSKKYCTECTVRTQCEFPESQWKEAASRQKARVVFGTHALAEHLLTRPDEAYSMVIIDESPLGTLLQDYSAGPNAILAYAKAKDITQDVAKVLLNALADGHTEDMPTDTHVQWSLTETGDEYSRAAAEAYDASFGASQPLAEDPPTTGFLQALQDQKTRVGSYVAHGRVVLKRSCTWHALLPDYALLLNGTGCEWETLAVLGPNATTAKVALEYPQNLQVSQMSLPAAKSDGPPKALATAPAGLIVGHKAWTEALVPALPKTTRYIHFGGTQATGVNTFKKLNKVYLCDYYVPKAALDSLAAFVMHLDPENASPICVAKFLLETAPVLQAASRIRPLTSPRAKKKTLVWVGKRVVKSFGFPPKKHT